MLINKPTTSYRTLALLGVLLTSTQTFAIDHVDKNIDFHQRQYNYGNDTITTVITPDSAYISNEKGEYLSIKREDINKLSEQYSVLHIRTIDGESRYDLRKFENDLPRLMDAVERDLASRYTGVLLDQFAFRSTHPEIFPHDVSPEEGAACLAGAIVAGIASGGWGAAVFGSICLKVLDDNSIETD